MALIRTFIAIEVPRAIQDKISSLQDALKKEGGKISWVKPENIHLTLKFLGNVEESKIDQIGEALTKAAERITPFNMIVKGTGAFPDMRRPRVIWVGVEEASGQLLNIFNEIEKELSKIGFQKEERRFSPHLTIGRVKTPSGISRLVDKLKTTDFLGGEFTAGEVVLMKSDLKPTGAVYTPLRKVKFREGDNA